MNVLSFNTQVKNPSKNLNESIKRLYRALGQNWNNERQQAWNERINFNIDYFKEHGRLPNNVDLAKVQGKDKCFEERRRY